jgi:hypothetical protein
MPLTNYFEKMELFNVVGTPRYGVPARVQRAEPWSNRCARCQRCGQRSALSLPLVCQRHNPGVMRKKITRRFSGF